MSEVNEEHEEQREPLNSITNAKFKSLPAAHKTKLLAMLPAKVPIQEPGVSKSKQQKLATSINTDAYFKMATSGVRLIMCLVVLRVHFLQRERQLMRQEQDAKSSDW